MGECKDLERENGLLNNKAKIKDLNFSPGDLVLMRNTEIESSLDKKMKPRYNGLIIF